MSNICSKKKIYEEYYLNNYFMRDLVGQLKYIKNNMSWHKNKAIEREKMRA